MKKILIWGDILCKTGFSRVVENIIPVFVEAGYEISIVGINYYGEPYDHNLYPYNIYPARIISYDPAYNDVFGRQRVLDLLGTGEFELFFSVQDLFITQKIGQEIKKTRENLAASGITLKWINYFPIDGIAREEWIRDAVLTPDIAVTYTNWAASLIKPYRKDIKVIYHGTDLNTFKPKDGTKFKELYLKTDKYIITNVNRNQPRKAVPLTLKAFKKFHEKHPKTFLYLHMNSNDVGGDISVVAQDMGLIFGEDYATPKNANWSDISDVYSVTDMLVTTTLGEGWGLSITEAMASKVPVVAPANSSINEIGADGRVKLYRTKGEIMLVNDNDQFRPLPDIDDMVLKMNEVYTRNQTEMIDKAYNWVTQYSWENIRKEWSKLL